MEQRRLRLGDILDDYCPRERRVTNHAVVAMIEEDVKQTRCTTCDAEHAYKGARVPKRRKKETPSALYKEVLAGMPEVEDPPVLAGALPVAEVPSAPPALPDTVAAPEVDAVDESSAAEVPPPASFAVGSIRESAASDDLGPGYDDAPESPEGTPVVDGPVHRPLIRATLPRPEGQKDARPVPDFTARHVPQRGSGHGGFRGDWDRMRIRGGSGNGNSHGHGNAHGHGNGTRAQGGSRFQGNRPQGQNRQSPGRAGGGQGFRNGNANGNKRGRGSRG
jgi:hypothetical protein